MIPVTHFISESDMFKSYCFPPIVALSFSPVSLPLPVPKRLTSIKKQSFLLFTFMSVALDVISDAEAQFCTPYLKRIDSMLYADVQ